MTPIPTRVTSRCIPFPLTAPIEGLPSHLSASGDHHLLVLDKNKMLAL